MFRKFYEKLDVILDRLRSITIELEFLELMIKKIKSNTESKEYISLKTICPLSTNTIKFGDEVLCRDHDKDNWKKCLYIKTSKEDYEKYPHVVYKINENIVLNYKYCIPYNEYTKHLENTTKNF